MLNRPADARRRDVPALLWHAVRWSAPRGARDEPAATAPDGAEDELLLCVPGAARRAAPGHHRGLGFLPRGRRCGGRADGGHRCTAREARAVLARRAGAVSTAAARARDRAGTPACSRSSRRSICRARRSRTSSTASRWISTRPATRPSTDLLQYCHRVASAVGMICIRIFGCTDRRAADYALQSRRRAAADEHPARRVGRSRPRPRVPPARRSRGVTAARVDDLEARRLTPDRSAACWRSSARAPTSSTGVRWRPARTPTGARLVAAEIMRAVYFEYAPRGSSSGGYDVFCRQRAPGAPAAGVHRAAGNGCWPA